MLKLVAFACFFAASGPAHKEPTPPTAPTTPAAPKVTTPEAPAAPAKGAAPKTEAPKGDAHKPEKGDPHKAESKTGKGDARSETTSEKTAEKGAEAPAPRSSSKGTSKVSSRGERGERATPPALSGSALRQEVGKSAEERPGAPLTERQRLEQLAAEITQAREALKKDTARLEAMLRGGGGGDMRMPLGDPTEPMPVGVAPGAAASKEAMKEQLNIVSKAMKGMKPEQAAAIVARLDRVLGAEILRRMRPADAGAVMGAIKPELAAELATLIATRKSLIDGDKKDANK